MKIETKKQYNSDICLIYTAFFALSEGFERACIYNKYVKAHLYRNKMSQTLSMFLTGVTLILTKLYITF